MTYMTLNAKVTATFFRLLRDSLLLFFHLNNPLMFACHIVCSQAWAMKHFGSVTLMFRPENWVDLFRWI